MDIALTRDAKYVTINSNTRTSSEVSAGTHFRGSSHAESNLEREGGEVDGAEYGP